MNPLTLLTTLSLLFFAIASSEDPPYGQLSVEGNQLMGDGKAVALHGNSLYWSQWMAKFWNADTIKALACSWNANVVRAAMAVDQGGYLSNPSTEQAKVEVVIEAAIANGIYVIVDWHDGTGTMQNVDQAVTFFTAISAKYGKYPNILYEPYNEPQSVSWSGQVKPYMLKVIAAIRANDPKNIIICGTPTWDQALDQAAADPITTFKNIMYTLHFYAGSHKQPLRDTAQAAYNSGLPIFVTEYGTVNADGNGAVDSASTQEWWTFLDKLKISYVNWAISDKAEGSAALIPGTSGTYEQVSSDSQLTESGKLVKTHQKGQDNGVKCFSGGGGGSSS